MWTTVAFQEHSKILPLKSPYFSFQHCVYHSMVIYWKEHLERCNGAICPALKVTRLITGENPRAFLNSKMEEGWQFIGTGTSGRGNSIALPLSNFPERHCLSTVIFVVATPSSGGWGAFCKGTGAFLVTIMEGKQPDMLDILQCMGWF